MCAGAKMHVGSECAGAHFGQHALADGCTFWGLTCAFWSGFGHFTMYLPCTLKSSNTNTTFHWSAGSSVHLYRVLGVLGRPMFLNLSFLTIPWYSSTPLTFKLSCR